MAYQPKVLRDLRKYIGHWSKENADTYTREHTRIVTQIQNTIWQNYDSACTTARPELPDQLDHPDFLGDALDNNDISKLRFDMDRRETPARRTKPQPPTEDAPPKLRQQSNARPLKRKAGEIARANLAPSTMTSKKRSSQAKTRQTTLDTPAPPTPAASMDGNLFFEPDAA